MNVRSIAGYAYSNTRRIGRRMRYNYYLKNWIESKKNRELLKKVRANLKDDLNDKNPLVSVQIPTWNRGRILTERTIPSVLRQTYQNFEIVIVGDHCTDDTEELIKDFDDDRIKFYNLPKRGEYPTNPNDRWMVVGLTPATKSLESCSGDWIAPMDDDDEFSEDHIEVLLNYALEHDYEMVYGVVRMEIALGKWTNVGSYPLKCGGISRLSVLYPAKLKFFKPDINTWKYGEPDDWNMWRRMKEAGVRIGFLDKIVGKHYLERQQWGK